MFFRTPPQRDNIPDKGWQDSMDSGQDHNNIQPIIEEQITPDEPDPENKISRSLKP
jgi:hypothetical protein